MASQEDDTAGASLKSEYEEQAPDGATYSEEEQDEYGIALLANSGWMHDNTGWWYQNSDGSYPVNQWYQLDGGKWYYFNSSGYMVTGSQYINGKWYYFASTGEMLTGWQQNSGGWWYYNSNGEYVASNYANGTIKGIDVSYYQGNIDWSAVKNSGIQYAFLRVGRSYYKDGYHHYTDTKFQEYVNNANAVGMPVGIYIYSKAKTPGAAISDAQYVIDMLKGHTISYPVAIDLEDSTQLELSKAQIGSIAKAFCDEIRKAGYTPMVYCNENWYKNYIDVSQISNEEMWVARYNYHYDTNIPRGVWQSGSTCRISGISGDVDIDFATKNYSSLISPRQYADSNYVATTNYSSYGWAYSNGTWYYFDANGNMCKGWVRDNGKWYYLNSNGRMLTGWVQLGGKWYYLDNSGAMLIGWQQIGGKWYYMNYNGEMLTGWNKIGNAWYFLNYNGKMLTNWLRLGNRWYYLNSSGAMTTGWQHIGGKWYLMNSSGVMLTGWQYVGGKWYYMNGSGVMLTGWQQIGGKWYFMNSSGVWLY